MAGQVPRLPLAEPAKEETAYEEKFAKLIGA